MGRQERVNIEKKLGDNVMVAPNKIHNKKPHFNPPLGEHIPNYLQFNKC